jgi:putative oligomerization/nucleic acid binding protein
MNRIILLALLLAGCANPGIVQLSPDTYLLSRVDKGGIFGNAAAMKAHVINQANDFAKSKGKVAIPVSTHEEPVYVGHFASFDYQFRLVDPNNPAAQSVNRVPGPNVVIEQDERRTIDVQSTNTTDAKPDLYTELVKLDDLRKKGIITENEFQIQKARILSATK